MSALCARGRAVLFAFRKDAGCAQGHKDEHLRRNASKNIRESKSRSHRYPSRAFLYSVTKANKKAREREERPDSSRPPKFFHSLKKWRKDIFSKCARGKCIAFDIHLKTTVKYITIALKQGVKSSAWYNEYRIACEAINIRLYLKAECSARDNMYFGVTVLMNARGGTV